MEPDAKTVDVEGPRGLHPARVDDKGRLKLPAAILKYLSDLGETKVFVTSLDGHIARIYPISVWKENEKVLQHLEDPKAAADISFIANFYGDDSEIDGQGRVLLHTELRRPLELENEAVYLSAFRGVIEISRKSTVDERMQQAMANIEEKKRAVMSKGFR